MRIYLVGNCLQSIYIRSHTAMSIMLAWNNQQILTSSKLSLNFLSYNRTERQRSGSFEVLTLAMILGNGSGTHFGASQCIPMGPCRLTRRLSLSLTLDVVMT